MILHGCKLKVAEAKNPMHVGLEGVVCEISSTFLHVASVQEASCEVEDSQNDRNARVCHIPKQGSIFTCILPGKREDRLFTLVGANLK